MKHIKKQILLSFLLLHSCFTWAQYAWRLPIYDAQLGDSQVIIVGVAHASRIPTEAYVHQAIRLLEGAQAVAVESTELRERKHPVSPNYLSEDGVPLSLTKTAKECIDNEARRGLKSGWKKNEDSILHLWQILSDLYDSDALAPTGDFFPGIDYVARVFAKRQNIEVVPLETTQEAFSFDQKQSDQNLLRAIDSLCVAIASPAITQMYKSAQEEALKAAQTGDPERVRAIVFKANREILGLANPDFHYVAQRNTNIAAAIANLSKSFRRSVVLVGILHLSGDSSLQKLLRNMGYDVLEISVANKRFRDH